MTVPLAMFGFIPFVMWLYHKLPTRRAALAGFLIGWMFLPDYTYYFPGLPNYDKTFAASFSVILSTLLFDSKRFQELQFKISDLLMFFWCLTPLMASLSNELGLYDGIASAKNYFTTWGAPYLIGRLYFTDWDAVRDLLWGLFLGALVYAPLCWFEMILSPQLHNMVYGFHAHDFIQSIRAVGYRPTVFMHHGLMVGMWMAAGSLAGLILWKWDGTVEKIHGYPLKWLVIIVVGTTVACQSMGALMLLLAGYGTLSVCKKYNKSTPILFLALFPALFLTMKVRREWTGYEVANFVKKFSIERAASFEYRVINEEMLVEKALERPLFGWAGWGRMRIYDDVGNDICVTDSYWILVFGQTGIVGLSAFCLILLVPILGFIFKFPVRTWKAPNIARATPLMMLLALYFADCLVNDMKTPVYVLIMGTLTNLLFLPPTKNGDITNYGLPRVII